MTDSPATWLSYLIRVLATILVVALGVMLLTAAVQFGVLGDYQDGPGSVYGVLFVVVVFSTLALGAAAACGRGGRANWLVPSMLASAGAGTWWIAYIMLQDGMGWQTQEFTTKVGTTLTVAAIALLYHEAVRLIESSAGSVIVARTALRIGAWCFATMIFLQLWVPEVLDALVKVFGAQYALAPIMTLLAVTTLLGPAVLKAMALRFRHEVKASHGTLSGTLALDLDCPQCQTEMAASVGPARCRECGFVVLIEIEEPRCGCGYLIYEHTSERCPECGLTIDPALRWRSVVASPLSVDSPPPHPPTSPTSGSEA